MSVDRVMNFSRRSFLVQQSFENGKHVIVFHGRVIGNDSEFSETVKQAQLFFMQNENLNSGYGMGIE